MISANNDTLSLMSDRTITLKKNGSGNIAMISIPPPMLEFSGLGTQVTMYAEKGKITIKNKKGV